MIFATEALSILETGERFLTKTLEKELDELVNDMVEAGADGMEIMVDDSGVQPHVKLYRYLSYVERDQLFERYFFVDNETIEKIMEYFKYYKYEVHAGTASHTCIISVPRLF